MKKYNYPPFFFLFSLIFLIIHATLNPNARKISIYIKYSQIKCHLSWDEYFTHSNTTIEYSGVQNNTISNKSSYLYISNAIFQNFREKAVHILGNQDIYCVLIEDSYFNNIHSSDFVGGAILVQYCQIAQSCIYAINCSTNSSFAKFSNTSPKLPSSINLIESSSITLCNGGNNDAKSTIRLINGNISVNNINITHCDAKNYAAYFLNAENSDACNVKFCEFAHNTADNIILYHEINNQQLSNSNVYNNSIKSDSTYNIIQSKCNLTIDSCNIYENNAKLYFYVYDKNSILIENCYYDKVMQTNNVQIKNTLDQKLNIRFSLNACNSNNFNQTESISEQTPSQTPNISVSITENIKLSTHLRVHYSMRHALFRRR